MTAVDDLDRIKENLRILLLQLSRKSSPDPDKELKIRIITSIVANGATYFAGVAPFTGRIKVLSKREREVVSLLGRGLGNRGIAMELGIKKKTVATHLGNVYMKLGLASRSELVWFVSFLG